MAVVTMHAASFPPRSIVSLAYSTPVGVTWAACARRGNSIANVNVIRRRISLLGPPAMPGDVTQCKPVLAAVIQSSRGFRARHTRPLSYTRTHRAPGCISGAHTFSVSVAETPQPRAPLLL